MYMYSSLSPEGPWKCVDPGQTYNNPTLVPRPDDSLVLYFHNVGAWGTAVSGVLATSTANGTLSKFVLHENNAKEAAVMGSGAYSNQFYIRPTEDSFAWYDAKAKRYRMLVHTMSFRMGMVCGAGTTAGACLRGLLFGYLAPQSTKNRALCHPPRRPDCHLRRVACRAFYFGWHKASIKQHSRAGHAR